MCSCSEVESSSIVTRSICECVINLEWKEVGVGTKSGLWYIRLIGIVHMLLSTVLYITKCLGVEVELVVLISRRARDARALFTSMGRLGVVGRGW